MRRAACSTTANCQADIQTSRATRGQARSPWCGRQPARRPPSTSASPAPARSTWRREAIAPGPLVGISHPAAGECIAITKAARAPLRSDRRHRIGQEHRGRAAARARRARHRRGRARARGRGAGDRRAARDRRSLRPGRARAGRCARPQGPGAPSCSPTTRRAGGSTPSRTRASRVRTMERAAELAARASRSPATRLRSSSRTGPPTHSGRSSSSPARRRSQIERVLARDARPRAEARARIRAQKPLAEKVAVADFVIDTSGTIEETVRRTDDVLQAICERLGVEWARYSVPSP